ncbi:hypothetical protein QA600_12080 [Natronococcus sp. A-GB1]|nr:hypothetical protein [Natronococcus sp. A-GB1]MDG5760079.1 hypothetical protein [Natronococcus sp. A-GB1]
MATATPHRSFNDGEGDFRCGTCSATSSGPTAEMLMGNRKGPY